MTRYLCVCALAIGTLIQGCSDTVAPAEPEKPTVQAAVVTPAPQGASLSLGVPESVSGLPFAVGGKCALDAIANDRTARTVSVSANADFAVYGWAFNDAAADAPVPPIVLLQLVRDGKYFHAAVARNAERGDVAKAFSNSALTGAGYSGSISTKGMPPGEYEALILQRTSKTNLICPTYRLIRITA